MNVFWHKEDSGLYTKYKREKLQYMNNGSEKKHGKSWTRRNYKYSIEGLRKDISKALTQVKGSTCKRRLEVSQLITNHYYLERKGMLIMNG